MRAQAAEAVRAAAGLFRWCRAVGLLAEIRRFCCLLSIPKHLHVDSLALKDEHRCHLGTTLRQYVPHLDPYRLIMLAGSDCLVAGDTSAARAPPER